MVGGLFVWWFQLNGGPCGVGVYLAPEAQRAYDTLLECVLNGQKGCEASAHAGMDTIKALV